MMMRSELSRLLGSIVSVHVCVFALSFVYLCIVSVAQQ